MQYINTDTEQPVTLGQIRAAHSRTAFPKGGPDDDWLADHGYARLTVLPRPEANPQTEYVTAKAPELVDGQWQSDWQVMDKPYDPKELTRYREQRITEGITVSGVTIQTDDQSQQRLMGARMAAKDDSSYTVKWKTPNGFADLTAAQIISISDAVRAHIQKCFDAQAAVEDNSFETIKQMRDAFDAVYDAV